MKLETKVNNNIHSSGVMASSQFKVDGNSIKQIIDLVTNQYTNQEMAFIRETCSNAYDAHTDNGKEDIPFGFKLPTYDDPTVMIRDYGKGLSEDFMINQYTAVFHSTKREGNDSIGGFGVGRLTFNLITDQALITSFQGGIKKVYNAVKDENGLLTINKLQEGVTSEDDGFCLKFSINQDRISAFNNSFNEYFKYVSRPRPNIVGHHWNEPNYVFKGDGWAIDSTISNCGVIMGDIFYSINIDSLYGHRDYHEVRKYLDANIVLFFDIGEVRPLPNREFLDMNEKTKDAIVNRVLSIKDEIYNVIENSIVDAPHYYEAILNKLRLSGTHHEISNLFSSFTYKDGREVHNNSTIAVKFNHKLMVSDIMGPEKKNKMIKDMDYTLIKKRNVSSYYSSNKKFKYDFKPFFAFSPNEILNETIIINDENRSLNSLKRIITHNFGNREVFILSANRDNDFSDIIQDLLDEGLKESQFHLSSELERPSSARPKKMDGEFKTVIEYNGCTNKLFTRDRAIDPAFKILYIKTKHSKPIDEYVTSLNKFMFMGDFLKKYFNDYRIIALNMRECKDIDGSWTCLNEFFKDEGVDKIYKEALRWQEFAFKSRFVFNEIDDLMDKFKRSSFRYDKLKSNEIAKIMMKANILKKSDLKKLLKLTNEYRDYARIPVNKTYIKLLTDIDYSAIEVEYQIYKDLKALTETNIFKVLNQDFDENFDLRELKNELEERI